MDNTTRKLVKLLHIDKDQVYHVFCLALCMTCADGAVTDREAEMLTRIGFGMGLSPEDIHVLTQNARDAITETSISDVIAFSVASLKAALSKDQLEHVRQVLKFVATSDREIGESEEELLRLIEEVWSC